MTASAAPTPCRASASAAAPPSLASAPTAAEAKHCACGSSQLRAPTRAGTPPASRAASSGRPYAEATRARAPTPHRCRMGSLLLLAQYATPLRVSGWSASRRAPAGEPASPNTAAAVKRSSSTRDTASMLPGTSAALAYSLPTLPNSVTRRPACVATWAARPEEMRRGWLSGAPANSATTRAACAWATCPSSKPSCQAPSALRASRSPATNFREPSAAECAAGSFIRSAVQVSAMLRTCGTTLSSMTVSSKASSTPGVARMAEWWSMYIVRLLSIATARSLSDADPTAKSRASSWSASGSRASFSNRAGCS
mmetsp:Transcript_4335/g.12521  ORF Transcript_4335/g.12521 Transcript_4335/m.12521 type:complete len:311 (-) Transcript_4335:365-1297(-)